METKDLSFWFNGGDLHCYECKSIATILITNIPQGAYKEKQIISSLYIQRKGTSAPESKEEAEHNLLLCYIDWKVGKGPA